jgi:polar amino acid transport system substrate-binding protein
MKRLLSIGLAALLFLGGAATNQALAQGALQEIKDRGKVLIAIGLSVPPYGMTDADQKPVGLDVDLANLIATDLGVELEIVSATAPNRIPYLQTDKVDMVISTFGVTPERALSIASPSHMAPMPA